MDNGVEHNPVLGLYGTRVDLRVSFSARSKAVAEAEEEALLLDGPLHLLDDLFLRERVDLRDPHASQFLVFVAIEGASGGVGVEDPSGGGIDQELHGAVLFEELAIECFGSENRHAWWGGR